jgi:DNA-binding NarL/FixJ family response regulator
MKPALGSGIPSGLEIGETFAVYALAGRVSFYAHVRREMPLTRVLIADDHPLVRSGLRALLERDGEFQVVAEAADGYEAIELSLLHKPDLILLDVGMPRVTGTDAAEHLSAKLPKTRIVIISMHSDEAYVLRALKAGARGYLLKASPEADVLAAARAVASGHAYFSPAISKMLVDDYVAEIRRRGVEDSYGLLSIREKEILQLLVSGMSNREIGDKIHISVATVETHRNSILKKLHLHSLPELILYAVRKGLVS